MAGWAMSASPRCASQGGRGFRRILKRFNYAPDHNGLKGYSGVYAVKYVDEKLGKLDRRGGRDDARPEHCAEGRAAS